MEKEELYHVSTLGIIRPTQMAILKLIPIQQLETPDFIRNAYFKNDSKNKKYGYKKFKRMD